MRKDNISFKRQLILDGVNPHTGKVLNNVKAYTPLEYWKSQENSLKRKSDESYWFSAGCVDALENRFFDSFDSKESKESYIKGYNRYKRKEVKENDTANVSSYQQAKKTA